jgi:serine/threonine-protein kinase
MDTKPQSNTETGIFGLGPNLDTEVGRVVMETGLATKPEIDFCREQQKQSSDPNQRSLADLLVEHGFITANQAKRIRKHLEERRNSQIPGYVLLGKIGKGAMATVYKARQVSLDRIVAIKVLPQKKSDSVDFVERFYKEGRAAAKLSHNNIVQAIDVGSTPDGFHYFVMEYVEGKTLYDIMQPPPVGEGRNFSEAEALDIGIQIADALAHAHQKGLIHRDVKPKNVILTPSNIAKLTDLGLARSTDDKQAAESEAGKAYGTPYYISPEQIRGDIDIDHRADIYSLGATLYHLVTGRPPFDGESPSAVMHKHLREPLTPPDHINVALSSGISEIIEVAMAKNRDERYQTTEDMLEDLKLVKEGQPPKHARRTIDLDALQKLEQHTQTLDLDAPPSLIPTIWQNPVVITLLSLVGLSVVLNIVFLVLILGR